MQRLMQALTVFGATIGVGSAALAQAVRVGFITT